MLSHFAITALDQFKQQGTVWDGDLVSKTGRTELIQSGLATRTNGGFNKLNEKGRKMALRLTGAGHG